MMKFLDRFKSKGGSKRDSCNRVADLKALPEIPALKQCRICLTTENTNSKVDSLDEWIERPTITATHYTGKEQDTSSGNVSPSSPSKPKVLKNGKVDKLISPCACMGSIAYVHRSCLSHWRRARFLENCGYQTKCELCHTEYKRTYKGFNVNEDWSKVAFFLVAVAGITLQHAFFWIVDLTLSQVRLPSSDSGSTDPLKTDIPLTWAEIRSMDFAWLVVFSVMLIHYMWQKYGNLDLSMWMWEHKPFSSLTSNSHQQATSSASVSSSSSSTPRLNPIEADAASFQAWSRTFINFSYTQFFYNVVDQLAVIPMIPVFILLSRFPAVQVISYLPDLLFKILACTSFAGFCFISISRDVVDHILEYDVPCKEHIKKFLPFTAIAILYAVGTMTVSIFEYYISSIESNYFVVNMVIYATQTIIEAAQWIVYIIGSFLCIGYLSLFIEEAASDE